MLLDSVRSIQSRCLRFREKPRTKERRHVRCVITFIFDVSSSLISLIFLLAATEPNRTERLLHHDDPGSRTTTWAQPSSPFREYTRWPPRSGNVARGWTPPRPRKVSKRPRTLCHGAPYPHLDRSYNLVPFLALGVLSFLFLYALGVKRPRPAHRSFESRLVGT